MSQMQKPEPVQAVQVPDPPAPPAADAPANASSSSSLFLNRELSLLEFNKRVLHQAMDPSTPLLERLKFLCISSSNLDEFFEIRVAGLVEQVKFGINTPGHDGLSAEQALELISATAHELVARQYQVLNGSLFPALAR